MKRSLRKKYKEGDIVGHFTYVAEAEPLLDKNGKGLRQAYFKCKCGNISIKLLDNVSRKHTKSCGCSKLHPAIKTHGKTETSEHGTWCGIKQRCYNPNNKSYKNYGGRGIRISDDWLKSFDCFYKDMGVKPSPKHSLDRIDVNGDYCKENCRWATNKEQSRNKRNNRYYEYNGESKILPDWSIELKITFNILRDQVYERNHSLDEVIKSYKDVNIL